MPNQNPNSSISRLSPTEIAAAANALAQMFMGFREHSSDPRTMARVYIFAVEDQPLWAIEHAALRFLKGQVVGRHDAFPPSTAEFSSEVCRLVRDEEEHQRLRAPPKFLPAPEISDEERARVSAGLQELAAEIRAGSDEAEEKRRARHRAFMAKVAEHFRPKLIAECEAAGVDPFGDPGKTIPVSMALREIIAAKPAAAEDGAADVA